MLSASTVRNGSRPVIPPPIRRDGRAGKAAPAAIASAAACGPQARQSPQASGQRCVLTAENVALADATFVEREQMSFGDVVDMHEIETGIEIGRHASGCGLDDDATCRRRLDVARSDGRRRAHQHGGQSLRDHVLDHAFGRDFAFLVNGRWRFRRSARSSSVASRPGFGFNVATLLV